VICCTLGAVAAATVAARRHRRPSLLRLAPAFALPVLSLALTGLAAWHLDHYAARAAANQRTLIAEILAAPLCVGAADQGN
jgi:hypothetical protein